MAKKGVLGTDSIQYGRVILLTNQENIESINDITSGVEVDIKKIDIQIAVLLQSHILHSSYAQQNRYQALLFRNGSVLRTNFYNKAQDDETGPFLVSKKLNKVMELFNYSLLPDRASFGFNYITISGGDEDDIRISVSSEQESDIVITAKTLKILANCVTNVDISQNDFFNNIQMHLNDFFLESSDEVKFLEKFSKEQSLNLFSNLFLLLIALEKEIVLTKKELIMKHCLLLQQRISSKEVMTTLLEHLNYSRKSVSIIMNIVLIFKRSKGQLEKL